MFHNQKTTLWIQTEVKGEQHWQAKWTPKESFTREQCGCCGKYREGWSTHLYTRNHISFVWSNSEKISTKNFIFGSWPQKWYPISSPMTDEQKSQHVMLHVSQMVPNVWPIPSQAMRPLCTALSASATAKQSGSKRPETLNLQVLISGQKEDVYRLLHSPAVYGNWCFSC